MSLATESILFDSLTVDPATPPDGLVWYRSDLNQFRQRANGVTTTLGGGGSSEKIISLAWGFDGVYGHSGNSYVAFIFNVIIPKLADVGTFTKVEAKFVIDYETEGSAQMKAELFDYTNFVAIAGTEVTFPNQTWGHGASGWIDLTSNEGHSIRLRNKRFGGGGTNNVKVEGATLLLKYT